ncbi:hypothetical protein [Myxococcus fulvus]|uniref:hypothetical protein n=1 Tax=Myxococcus fulvus TaxID=33 RepID=UPI0020BE9D58|nr:hypothetical protein [Myxococcus fulvus]MCK8497240.1 hypothetical protein [Myxococcus fulvus]
MKRWTRVWMAVVSFAVLSACGGVDAQAPLEQELGEQEARIDVCGNGLCFRLEPQSCPEDCPYSGYCGDGICQSSYESSAWCSDCSAGPGCLAPEAARPSEPEGLIDVCGNGLCFRLEPQSCPEDCSYSGYCGDGVCQSSYESSAWCSDCSAGPGCLTP